MVRLKHRGMALLDNYSMLTKILYNFIILKRKETKWHMTKN